MTTILERNRALAFRLKAGANMPNPKAFQTEGPRSMRFCAYDPDRFDVCGDPDCSCRMSKGNIRGFGATEQEALADFWEQYEEAE